MLLNAVINTSSRLHDVSGTAAKRNTLNEVYPERKIGSSMSPRAGIWRVVGVDSLAKRRECKCTDKLNLRTKPVASIFIRCKVIITDTSKPGGRRLSPAVSQRSLSKIAMHLRNIYRMFSGYILAKYGVIAEASNHRRQITQKFQM